MPFRSMRNTECGSTLAEGCPPMLMLADTIITIKSMTIMEVARKTPAAELNTFNKNFFIMIYNLMTVQI